MQLSSVEKIKILAKRKNMTIGEIADKTGQTRQNLSNKFSRDNLTESEIRKIAEVLNVDVDIVFSDTETGEKL